MEKEDLRFLSEEQIVDNKNYCTAVVSSYSKSRRVYCRVVTGTNVEYVCSKITQPFTISSRFKTYHLLLLILLRGTTILSLFPVSCSSAPIIIIMLLCFLLFADHHPTVTDLILHLLSTSTHFVIHRTCW